MAAFSGRFRELMKKYGKVALGVHFSVSFASIAGLYVAINNNVDVESLFEKVGLASAAPKPEPEEALTTSSDRAAVVLEDEAGNGGQVTRQERRNKTTEMVASTGGALALAILLNKALFPVRVPITIALTPPVARFLARRNIIKSHGI